MFRACLLLSCLVWPFSGAAATDLSWIRSFTVPATSENLANETVGEQNKLNWDPRYLAVLKTSFPQHQNFWFDHGRFTPLPDLIRDFTGVPGIAALSQDRYVTLAGCVPHDCGDRGFVWIDTKLTDTKPASRPTLIFVATGQVRSSGTDARVSLIHLRLFSSNKLDHGLPAEFVASLTQWWNKTTKIWTEYVDEKIALVTIIQPSGEEVDLSPSMVKLDSPGN